MKILYLASKTPFPVHDGGAFASYSFLEQLQKIAELDGIIIQTAKHPFTANSSEKLGPIFQKLSTPFVNTNIKAGSAILSLFKNENYNLKRFKVPHLVQEIENYLSSKTYDWIIADSVFAAAVLQQVNTTTKIAIRTHNVEFEIWQKLSESTTNPFKKWYLSNLARSLKNEELALIKSANCILTITKSDQNTFERLIPTQKFYLLPVVVHSPPYALETINPQVFHLGSMDWVPNQEAVSFLFNLFTKSPKLKNIQLNLAGKKLQKGQFQAANIKNFGEIEDSHAFMSTAGILVAPILSGSGIRIKILEALSLGIPVITTELGASGISIEDSGIRIAGTFEAFESRICELIENKALRNELGQKGFMYIRTKHNFNQATAILEDILGS